MISIISLAAADKRPETHEASSLLVSVKLRELPVGSLTCKAAGMQWWWGRGGGGWGWGSFPGRDVNKESNIDY